VSIEPSSGGLPGDGHVLASDVEREAVVERLRVAAADGRLTMEELDERSEAAYRARTTAELAVLTHDLPTHHAAARPHLPAAPADDDTERYVAVFSGADRSGSWRVPRRAQAVAVFGGVNLDMRGASFTDHDVVIDATAVFGGVSIMVPEGVEVRLTGWAVFGGKTAKVPPAPAGAPVLWVRCKVAFGGVDVRTKTGLENAMDIARQWDDRRRIDPPGH
jgi:hypothetical protein